MNRTALPQAPPIPGLRFRRDRGTEDLPAMLRVGQAAREADGREEVLTLEQITINYATLVNCDPELDIVLAEVGDAVVAYARVYWTDLVEGGRSYENFGGRPAAFSRARRGSGHASRNRSPRSAR